jgi:predicted DNA-binding transcriptional regulator AlpA
MKELPAERHVRRPLGKILDAALYLRIAPVTVYRIHAADPTFPRLIRIGPQSTRIDMDELEAWAASQPRGTGIRRRGQGAKRVLRTCEASDEHMRSEREAGAERSN